MNDDTLVLPNGTHSVYTFSANKANISPQPLVKFRSHLYYEDKDDLPEAIKNLKALKGSKILFFK